MELVIADINEQVYKYMQSDEFKGAYPRELLAKAYNQANCHVHRAMPWEHFQFFTALAAYAKKAGGDAFRWFNINWQAVYAGALKELEIFNDIANKMKREFTLFNRLFWVGHQMARRFLYKRGQAPKPFDVGQLVHANKVEKLNDLLNGRFSVLGLIHTNWEAEDEEQAYMINPNESEASRLKRQGAYHEILACVVILGAPTELSQESADKKLRVYSDEERAFALKFLIEAIGTSYVKKDLLKELKQSPDAFKRIRKDWVFPEILVSQFNL
jgi:hypothetical protein